MNPILLIPLTILIYTWSRLFRPVHHEVEGTSLRITALPLLAKLRMHLPLSATAIILTFALALTGNAPWWAVALTCLSLALLLVLPVQYTITDEGLRLGWSSFRRWTEFAGVRRTRFGAQLQGVHGRRGMTIWLSGDRGDDEFLLFLKQTMRRAYTVGSQAYTTSIDQPGTVRFAASPGADHESIAAFTRTDVS